MTSPPGMLWGSIGSLGMPGYEVRRLLMNSQVGAPFEVFFGAGASLGGLQTRGPA
jgi:hypothetical protein